MNTATITYAGLLTLSPQALGVEISMTAGVSGTQTPFGEPILLDVVEFSKA